jgi:hypothetical protein
MYDDAGVYRFWRLRIRKSKDTVRTPGWCMMMPVSTDSGGCLNPELAGNCVNQLVASRIFFNEWPAEVCLSFKKTWYGDVLVQKKIRRYTERYIQLLGFTFPRSNIQLLGLTFPRSNKICLYKYGIWIKENNNLVVFFLLREEPGRTLV